jgi:hypothetical protein
VLYFYRTEAPSGRTAGTHGEVLLLWIDEMIAAGKTSLLEKVAKNLGVRFPIKGSNMSYFLGLKFE